MQKPTLMFPVKYIGMLLLLLCIHTLRAQDAGKDSTAAVTLLKEAKSFFFTDKQAMLDKAAEGLKVAERINNKTLQGNFNNIMGVAYTYLVKFELANKSLIKARDLAIAINDKVLLSKAYTNLGLNYMQWGKQLPAINESLKAIKTLEEIGAKTGYSDIYANISNSYIVIENFDKAKIYADSALKQFKLEDKTSGIGNIYNNFGLIATDKKQYESALDYYQKSLAIKRQLQDKTGEANTLINIATVCKEMKAYNKAIAYFKMGEKLYTEVKDPKGMADAMTGMAQTKALQNDSSGIGNAMKALEYAKNNSALEQQAEAALTLAHSYKQHKDFENAYKYHRVYDSVENEILNASTLNQINALETKYQTEKKQQQIALLSKQNTIQQLQISKKDLTIYIIAIAFALSAVIAYQLYSRNKIKQQAGLLAAIAHQQNLAAKGIIEAEERERKRIAGDLHDGVGQLFSAVKLNLGVLISKYLAKGGEADLLAEKTMAMVDESCTEVRSIAHQMMPNALIKSGLVSAVRDFVNKIQSDKLKIVVQAQGIDQPLDDNVETVLYRVIQESVNNVIKHAAASMLDIFLLRDDNEITVTIEDNGKGFDSADKSKFGGIGLKNIVSRVEFLKGTVDISSQPGKGTLVAIYVPLG